MMYQEQIRHTEKLPIFMIVRDGNTFVEKMTPKFNEFVMERD